jgi:mono/diheme cytochrome c family protein
MRTNPEILPGKFPGPITQKNFAASIRAGFRRCHLGLVAMALAGGMAQAAAAQAPEPEHQIRPAVLYHNYCSVCHGDKGDGKSRAQSSLVPPPRDFTMPDSATQLSRARVISAITHGRPGTAMTAWSSQLNTQEIEALADYIRETFMPASTSAGSSRGRIVYAKSCSVCHGDMGRGSVWASGQMRPPPRDFSTPQARAELSRQRMITSVSYGRPETAMAGFKTQLSEADIEAVVDYIRSGFMAPASTEGISGTRAHEGHQAAAPAAAVARPTAAAVPVAADMSLPLPDALTGNPDNGAAFYMANCATCHGETGDGRGPRAYFINPKPRNFLHPASRQALNLPALFSAISLGRLGTEMPAWNKVMEPRQIADVAEFVFQKFIRAPDPQPQQEPAAGK